MDTLEYCPKHIFDVKKLCVWTFAYLERFRELYIVYQYVSYKTTPTKNTNFLIFLFFNVFDGELNLAGVLEKDWNQIKFTAMSKILCVNFRISGAFPRTLYCIPVCTIQNYTYEKYFFVFLIFQCFRWWIKSGGCIDKDSKPGWIHWFVGDGNDHQKPVGR